MTDKSSNINTSNCTNTKTLTTSSSSSLECKEEEMIQGLTKLSRQSSPASQIEYVVLSACPFDKWAKRTSTFLKKTSAVLPLFHIFQWLPLPQIARLRTCSKKLNHMLSLCASATAPRHVLKLVDDLIAKSHIRDAEQLLRPFVASSTRVRTPVSLMNRYILLLHSEIWSSSRFKDLRRPLFQHFQSLALNEYDVFDVQRGTDARAQEGQRYRDCVANFSLSLKNRKQVVIGDKFIDQQFPTDDFQAIQRVSTKFYDSSYQEANNGENLVSAPSLPQTLKNISSFGAAGSTVSTMDEDVHDHFLRPNHNAYDINGEATCLLAYFLYKDAQFDACAHLIQQASIYDNAAPLVHWTQGVLQHYHSKNFRLSCAAYTRAITLSPKFAYPYYSLAVLASDSGDQEKADFLYRQCIDLDPCHHFARMNRVITMNDPASEPAVISEYRHILKIHPTELYAHRAYAQLCLRKPTKENVATASKLLHDAIRLDPEGCGGLHLMDLFMFSLRTQFDLKLAKKCFLKFCKVCEDQNILDRIKQVWQYVNAGTTNAMLNVDDEDTDEYGW